MGVGIVETTVIWATYEEELKEYCNINGASHDTILARFMTAAARHADEFLRNPFTENQVKVTLASVQAGDVVVVDGAIFTAAAATDETEREFAVGVSDTADAVALLALINSTTIGGSHGAIGIDTVIGTSALGVVTLKHRYPNEGEIVVTSTSDTRLRVSVIREQLTIPDDVLLWCWQYVAWKFGNRDGRKAERAEMGIESIEWGDQPDETLLSLYVSRVLEIV